MASNLDNKITQLEKRLTRNPNHQDDLYSLGCVYLETGRHEDALKCFIRRINIDSKSAYNHCALGWAYLHTGVFHKALESYNKALSISPSLVLALSGQADSLYRLGKIDTAYENIQSIFSNRELKLNQFEWGDCVAALRVYSKICNKYQKCDECIDLIKIALKYPELNKESRISLSYALAILFDKNRQYKSAYKYCNEANKLTGLMHSHQHESKRNNSIISSFSSEKIPVPVHIDNSSTRPVFILGMPRSGTSLIEQILSKHTEIYAAGELNTLTEIANVLYSKCGYPLTLENLNKDVLGQAARHYLTTINKMSLNKPLVTDKMPANFLHLGLIYLLFPDAIIIHAQRNPLDVCLSIYFQRFTNVHSYSSDMNNIASYHLEYTRLMEHWQNVLPVNIYNLYYEDLVMSQEKVSRALIDYCGLTWDSACLDFHDADRVVKTASQEQVKQKLYNSSLNRWKHYDSDIPESVKDKLFDSHSQYLEKLKGVMSRDTYDAFQLL